MDIRDAMREGRERSAQEQARASETSEHRAERLDREREARAEAHWQRLHAQIDHLPWQIVGVQLLLGLIVGVLLYLAR